MGLRQKRGKMKLKKKMGSKTKNDDLVEQLRHTVAERELKDLRSVSRSTLRDFELLGIKTVAQLAQYDAKDLYRKLCKLSEDRHDICTQDVLNAAIAQAKDPALAEEKCDWWYWNRKRQKSKDPF